MKPGFAVFASKKSYSKTKVSAVDVRFPVVFICFACVRRRIRISLLTLGRTELKPRSTTLSLQILLEQIEKHFEIYPFCLLPTLNYRLLGKCISLSLFSVRLTPKPSELLSNKKYSQSFTLWIGYACEPPDAHNLEGCLLTPECIQIACFSQQSWLQSIVIMFGLAFSFTCFLAILNLMERQICFLFFF